MNPINRFFVTAKVQPKLLAIASAQYEMTYEDLADTANRFAAKFKLAGIKKGSIVALKARPEIEVVAMVAAMQLGAISLRATQQILNSYSSGIEFLVTDDALLAPSGLIVVEVDFQFLQELNSVPPVTSIVELSDFEVCRIVFSSGTTGTPKGVEFKVSYLEQRIQSAFTNWVQKPPFMSFLGLDTVTGFQTFFWAILNSETYFYFVNAGINLDTINKFKIATIKTSAARLKDFVLECEKQEIGSLPIETIQVAGSLLSSALADRCLSRFGIQPTYLYGSTEVGTVTRGEFKALNPANVGTRVDDVELQIVNPNGSQTANQVEGLIRFRKAGMPKNYWLTNQTNSNSGFKSDWFYSGDYGLIDESGQLIIRGRKDDLVNAGGAKFNLLELDIWLNESRLFEEAASFQFLDEDGDNCIGVAFVSSAEIPPEVIISRLDDFLPGLNVRSLLRLSEVPRNQLGKVDRNSLTSLAKGI